MAKDDELQAAADRGELRGARTPEAYVKALAATERRWIVLQAVEIAKNSPMTPAQFKELCEFMDAFTRPPPAPET